LKLLALLPVADAALRPRQLLAQSKTELIRITYCEH